MIKKFLPITAVTTLAFMACSPDESSSPIAPIAESSSSILGTESPNSVNSVASSSSVSNSSSSSLNQFSSSSIANQLQHFTKNECSVTKLSDNVVLMDFTVANSESVQMKMTLVGTDVEMDMVTTYDAFVSNSEVEQTCAEAKEKAAGYKNASVTCDGHTITVKYIDSANGQTADDVVESSNQLCSLMNLVEAFGSSSSTTNPSSPSSSSFKVPVSNKEKPNDAVCEVFVDLDTAFVMTAVKPDSIIININMNYNRGTLVMSEVMQFADAIPETTISEICNQAKEDARKDPLSGTVYCNGKNITQSLTLTTVNSIPVSAPDFIADCDEINATGILVEDED
ncbi:hypothetical protein [uncultured Fibrobacter sp.]|uniref:hypothetical protein n=1 Tax=uncultured Fibrobacter sp. TaxID=261512 RepID=UPI0025DA617F|nr:hypothetical protein [uncultured Fibrobacter sp.]